VAQVTIVGYPRPGRNAAHSGVAEARRPLAATSLAPPSSPCIATARAGGADSAPVMVVVFTVGLGQDVDVPALAAMASRPEYAYLAPDAEALAGIRRTIAVEIPYP
jgi:hypothetical protein